MLSIDLSRKVAVVTGASGDLGRVIVRTLADCGAAVAIQYHSNKDLASQLEHDLSSRGVTGFAIQADITDEASVNQMQQAIAAKLGDADIVVNAAVIQYAWTSVLDQSLADYESQFRSCVLHNVLMAKAFVPAMVRKGWGRVIALNTECTLQCWPSQSAYVSGKQGMAALLATLSKEVGPNGVTVNQVAPGWMESDRDFNRKETSPELAAIIKAYSDMIPLKHRGQDQDIAHAVAFLASDLARFINGVLLPVNGGGPVIPTWLH